MHSKRREGARIGAGFDQDRRPCPDRLAPGLPLAYRQAFFAVEPIDPVDAGRFAFAAKQNEQPPPLGIMLRMTLPGSG
ncbi:hypothetical protein GCM10022290_10040 [Sagittula marina]